MPKPNQVLDYFNIQEGKTYIINSAWGNPYNCKVTKINKSHNKIYTGNYELNLDFEMNCKKLWDVGWKSNHNHT